MINSIRNNSSHRQRSPIKPYFTMSDSESKIPEPKKKIPEKVDAHLIQVKVDYPMRGGWLYEYFALDSKPGERRPRVHGRAVMLADRRVEDTSVYAVDPKKIPSDIEVIWGFFRDKLFSFTKW